MEDDEFGKPPLWRRCLKCFVLALVPAAALLATGLVLLSVAFKPIADDGIIVGTLPDGSGNELIVTSICIGAIMALISLLFCFGAARNKGGLLCLVMIILLPLIGLSAAATAVLILADPKLTTAVEASFDVDVLRAEGDGDVADWLLDLYSSFALAFAFCDAAPEPLQPDTSVAAWPQLASFVCRSGFSEFSDWANKECLGAPDEWDAAHNAAYLNCTAALVAAKPSSGPSSDETACRLFCACPDAVDTKVRGSLKNGWSAALGTAFTLLVFAGCAFFSKKAAGKAKKRKARRKLLEAEAEYDEREGPADPHWGTGPGEDVYATHGSFAASQGSFGGRNSMLFVTLEKRDGKLGLTLTGEEGNPVIEAMAPGSAAAESKLQVGDILLSVDGKKTDRGHSEATLMLNYAGPQARIQVTREL